MFKFKFKHIVLASNIICGSVVCDSVCQSVCLSVCLHDNSKTNDPKVFKLGIENDLGISYKMTWFWGFKVTGLTAIRREFELCEYFLDNLYILLTWTDEAAPSFKSYHIKSSHSVTTLRLLFCFIYV